MNDSIVSNTIPLSKSPLGIIALFIILVYGFASLVVGASSQLSQEERTIIVYFMVTFPVMVLVVFSWLVSNHHHKLYRPDDFKKIDGFIEAYREGRRDTSNLPNLDREIELQINKIINPEDLREKFSKVEDAESAIRSLASELRDSIRSRSFVKVDISEFHANESVIELPVAAFSTMRDFFDEVYFLIGDVVEPFEYGYSWVLQDVHTKKIIESMGMRQGIKKGAVFDDVRSLNVAGVFVGQTYKAIKPRTLPNKAVKVDR